MIAPEYSLRDGTSLPAIGLGTYGLNDQSGIEAIVSAISDGYRLLDTAYNYGNEDVVGEAVRRAKASAGHLMKVEVEIDSLDQLDEALKHGPDAVMLDNFSLEDLGEAVRRVAGRAVLEASGGVNLETVRAIAETGVDVISVGALTHSASVLDIGLDAV